MCRLFGLRANHPVDIEFSMLKGPKTILKLSYKNPDGWGIGWFEEGQPRVRKEAISAANSTQFRPFAASVVSSLVIAHIRLATCGDHTDKNCHPFLYGNWLFAHNGSVDREDLLKKLNKDHRSALEGETDSEVYFHWLLQNIESAGSVRAGVCNALKEITIFSSLNFLLADQNNLYAYRNASKTTDNYSLFYLLRHPGKVGLEELRSREVQTLLQSKTLRGEKAVLICSEKLTDEPWQEIPLGYLLGISHKLTIGLLEVK